MAARALVRGVPDSFDRALVRGADAAIDVSAARRQHHGYRNLLLAAGYGVAVLEADEAHPDCPFVEDTAVIVDDRGLITRPGAPSRRGETVPVATYLGRRMPIVEMQPPGTMDGGDVLRLGSAIFVGRSERTNDDGIRQLAALAAGAGMTVTPVAVRDVLHLKSAVAALDGETVLLAPGSVDEAVFAGYRIIHKAPADAKRASALRLRSGRILVTANAPDTAESIAAAGFEVVPVDVSEFQTADGGLTCLSILV